MLLEKFVHHCMEITMEKLDLFGTTSKVVGFEIKLQVRAAFHGTQCTFIQITNSRNHESFLHYKVVVFFQCALSL